MAAPQEQICPPISVHLLMLSSEESPHDAPKSSCHFHHEPASAVEGKSPPDVRGDEEAIREEWEQGGGPGSAVDRGVSRFIFLRKAKQWHKRHKGGAQKCNFI